MAETAPVRILYPIFAMFLLVAIVLVRLAQMRLAALGRREVSVKYYRAYRDGEEPEALRVVSRHFVNLFELPVLFYVGVILAYVTNQANAWLVGCAWAYVAARYLHSYVHLTSNNVVVRFRLYMLSGLVLLVLWGSLLVQLVRAG